ASRGLQVTMVDASGQIVAHSQPEGRLLTAAQILNADQAPAEIAHVLTGERGSVIARDVHGKEWLYSYAPISAAGWGVIVQRPTEIAFASARTFHRGLLLAIGIITLGAMLFWWGLSRQVIRPLEQLTRYSRLSSRGQASGEQRESPSEPGNVHQRSLAALARRDDQVGELARTLHRRLHELEMLLETSTAVVSSLDAAQVLDTILEQVHRLLAVNTCAVLVLNPDSEQLQVRASRGLSEHYVQELRLDTSPRHLPAWRAIDSKQPVQVADVERDPTMAALLPLVRREGYRALLAVPLITRHGPPAVLVIYHVTPHEFSTDEVQLAATFANQAAMAIENATLFARTDEELQKQVRSLTILNQVMLTASQSLVLDDVLSNALDAVIELVQADLAVDAKAAWIYLLREGEDVLWLRAQRGLSERFVSAVGEVKVGAGLVGAVAGSGQPLLVEEIDRLGTCAEERASVQAAADEGLRSLAAVALRAKEVTVGVLGVATRTDRCFAQSEVDLLSAIGSQVGIAVENARLYQRTRQAAVLEERNRLAREIHDALAQGLTGIIVQLEAMERLAERRPEQALASLQRAKDLARRSLQEARRSVSGLRPSSLEDMTLAEALRARVEGLASENGLHASFGSSGARRVLSPDVELNLFRIAQEALVNVQRHAQASAVHVQLDYGHAHVRLIVEDDGVGLDTATDGAARGFGLTGMKERTALLGGEIVVSGEPGQGTRVQVIVPG
ncbi:MAG TPA: GAF domain-containing protein, partial [Anaerolineae bacterium]|nr:GAF domain-containing protein [Anaerolineae bacterium]